MYLSLFINISNIDISAAKAAATSADGLREPILKGT